MQYNTMQVNNHPLSIRVLLEAGANMDAVDDRGITALHLAASAGHVLVMQHLLVCGVNVDRTDVHGSAPLH
jgi:ankyrin repeat protein